MDYKRTYNQIIERAKDRIVEGYIEKHHIIPRCMGGSDDKSNLVELTAREHFVAHRLLCEIYPENHKLQYALWMMSNANKNDIYNISSREYERYRINFSILRSKDMMSLSNPMYNMTGSLNHFYGKTHSKETIEQISKKNKQHIKKNGHHMTGKTGSLAPFYGKNHTEEWKRNQSNLMEGVKNPMYGMTGSLHPFYGKTHSSSSKKKISKTKKKWYELNKHPNLKKVLYIETGKEFNSVKEAAEWYDCTSSNIIAHCKNKVKKPEFKYI